MLVLFRWRRCNIRRIVETAAHLTDHVLPDLPLRQWLLSVPGRLRYFLHRDTDLQGAVLRLFLRAVEQCLRAHSPGSGPAARLGAVAPIHRFGSRLNAHLHFHCVVIDGVFEPAPADGMVFRAATGLEDNAIAQVQAGVRRRGLLHRHRYFGVLAPNAPLRTAVTALAPGATTAPPALNQEPATEPAHRRAARYAWTLLLVRSYEVFPLVCPTAVAR